MNGNTNRKAPRTLWLIASLLVLTLAPPLPAQDVVTDGLLRPAKLIRTPLGNLLVAEVGTAEPNSSAVSIIDTTGNRRTLLSGLPAAINAVNTPTGTSGLYLRGRTLFVVTGEGDVTLPGPVPRTEIVNPTPATPLFSCLLAVHFSAAVEQNTTGVALSLDDHCALFDGLQLVRQDSDGRKITIQMVVDFPDYVPEPVPALATNVRHSHPYGVVADEDFLYVVDGGYNVVHKVDILTGAYITLTSFPRTPNPGTFGPPLIENVPTSIRWSGDQLVVTLLSGFPFIAGLSEARTVDPDTGDSQSLIPGLASAIDILPVLKDGVPVAYLALEYSVAHLAGGPGRLRVFDTAGTPLAVLSNTLVTPSAMVYDRDADRIIVAELNTNRLIAIPLP